MKTEYRYWIEIEIDQDRWEVCMIGHDVSKTEFKKRLRLTRKCHPKTKFRLMEQKSNVYTEKKIA